MNHNLEKSREEMADLELGDDGLHAATFRREAQKLTVLLDTRGPVSQTSSAFLKRYEHTMKVLEDCDLPSLDNEARALREENRKLKASNTKLRAALTALVDDEYYE